MDEQQVHIYLYLCYIISYLIQLIILYHHESYSNAIFYQSIYQESELLIFNVIGYVPSTAHLSIQFIPQFCCLCNFRDSLHSHILQMLCHIIDILSISAMRGTIFCIFIINLLISYGRTAMTVVVNLSINSPAHVYKVVCEAGGSISGKVSWNNTADLDVNIYAEGTDLINGNELQKFKSQNEYEEAIYFMSFWTATYFLKVLPYDLMKNQFLAYSIILSVSDPTLSIMQYNGFYMGYLSSNAYILPNRVKPVSTSYTLASDVPSLSLTLFGTQLSDSFLPTADKMICMPDQPSTAHWIFLLNEPAIFAATKVIPISLTIYQDIESSECLCAPGFVLDSKRTSQCQPYNSNKTVGIIVGSVLGAVGLITMIAVGIYCYRKHHKSQQDLHVKGSNRLRVDDPQPSQKALNIDLSALVCSICLESNCNTALPCKHTFHTQCIKAWLKKNSLCPLCRNSSNQKRKKDKSVDNLMPMGM